MTKYSLGGAIAIPNTQSVHYQLFILDDAFATARFVAGLPMQKK